MNMKLLKRIFCATALAAMACILQNRFKQFKLKLPSTLNNLFYGLILRQFKRSFYKNNFTNLSDNADLHLPSTFWFTLTDNDLCQVVSMFADKCQQKFYNLLKLFFQVQQKCLQLQEEQFLNVGKIKINKPSN